MGQWKELPILGLEKQEFETIMDSASQIPSKGILRRLESC
jgi:hypothetical protein